MPSATVPASIEIWEVEDRYVYEGLDLDYVDACAADVALILSAAAPAEARYQPGDGTCYPLVFVPLRSLRTARPRVKNGVSWDSHAVTGMSGPDGGYDSAGYLVSLVDVACYPLELGPGRQKNLAASYVAEHWKQNNTSAVSITLLFRAIAYHLNHPAEQPHLRD